MKCLEFGVQTSELCCCGTELQLLLWGSWLICARQKLETTRAKGKNKRAGRVWVNLEVDGALTLLSILSGGGRTKATFRSELLKKNKSSQKNGKFLKKIHSRLQLKALEYACRWAGRQRRRNDLLEEQNGNRRRSPTHKMFFHSEVSANTKDDNGEADGFVWTDKVERDGYLERLAMIKHPNDRKMLINQNTAVFASQDSLKVMWKLFFWTTFLFPENSIQQKGEV